MIEEDLGAFIDDDESNIIHRVYLVAIERAKAVADPTMNSGRVWFIAAPSPWKARNDGIWWTQSACLIASEGKKEHTIVQYPEPELIYHDDPGG
jgi:hypothetical protein